MIGQSVTRLASGVWLKCLAQVYLSAAEIKKIKPMKNEMLFNSLCWRDLVTNFSQFSRR